MNKNEKKQPIPFFALDLGELKIEGTEQVMGGIRLERHKK